MEFGVLLEFSGDVGSVRDGLTILSEETKRIVSLSNFFLDPNFVEHLGQTGFEPIFSINHTTEIRFNNDVSTEGFDELSVESLGVAVVFLRKHVKGLLEDRVELRLRESGDLNVVPGDLSHVQDQLLILRVHLFVEFVILNGFTLGTETKEAVTILSGFPESFSDEVIERREDGGTIQRNGFGLVHDE